jgi:para-nitrobenzyl esterase
MVGSRMTRRAMIGGALSVAAGTIMPVPALAQGTGRTDEAATCYGRVRGDARTAS